MDDDLQAILKSLDIDCDEPLPITQASSAFEENTLLALAKVRQILALSPKPSDEHYAGILRAQSQIATAQIAAQLRVAEGRLKALAIERDFYAELSEALARYQAGLQ